MVTEREILDLLRRRYSEKHANGERYVYAEQVRSTVGFDAPRTCDAMAWALWESDGLALHGHEVKTTRADWLRELLQPEKAREFMLRCDYWWLVAPVGVALRSELPEGWGLIEVAGSQLQRAVEAPLLIDRSAGARDDWWVVRSFSLAFARAAVRTANMGGESAAPLPSG